MNSEERRRYKIHGWIYLLDDIEKTAWIAKGKLGRRKRLRLPEKLLVDGIEYTVESVEHDAFKSSKMLRKVTVPDSYTYLDRYAFDYMPRLHSAYIGKNVEYWTSWHFSGQPVTISKENHYFKVINKIVLTSDGKRLIGTTCNAAHYTIPEGVEAIDSATFMCIHKMRTVSFPSTLKCIGSGAFYYCRNLERLDIPEGVEEIGEQCFEDCENLVEVIMPSTLRKGGGEIFRGCVKLANIECRRRYEDDRRIRKSRFHA